MKRAVVLLLMMLMLSGCARRETPVLKVGYVGHDHQAALYIAALQPERTRAESGVWLKEVAYKKHYELMREEKKLCDVELYLAGGGSKMPTMMSQDHFEIGFGGVAPVAYFVDKGSPMKIISPLHAKGDMLVLKPDAYASDWEGFVRWVKGLPKPVRIGFKNPVAIAKIVFESALDVSGITHSSDPANSSVHVHMVHMKGEKHLVPGLQNNLIEGYVSNNPWCVIAEQKGVGKIVADLNDLPPGTWKDHPCCCVAGTDAVLREKPELVQAFLELVILATNYLNADQTQSVKDAAGWIGTTESVEAASLPTSGFSTQDSEYWKGKMMVWVDEMNRVGKLRDRLQGADPAAVDTLLYNFTALNAAADALQRKGIKERY